MKAERRHELQTNALADTLARAPEYWQRYGGKILLVVVAALAVFLLVRFRISSAREADVQLRQAIAQARSELDTLRSADVNAMPAEALLTARRQQYEFITQLLDVPQNQSDSPQLAAQALVLRGDLNWTLATAPEPITPAPATTQPAATATEPVMTREEHLAEAREAYEAVLATYPDQPIAVAAARFGLAAIAENGGAWDVAAEQYQAVADDESIYDAHRTLAESQLERLPRLRQPVLLATPATRPVTPITPASSLDALQLPDLDLPTLDLPTQTPAAPTAAPTTAPTTVPAAQE